MMRASNDLKIKTNTEATKHKPAVKKLHKVITISLTYELYQTLKHLNKQTNETHKFCQIER